MISMSAQSNIAKFQNKLVGRFVSIPLLFWKDGSATSKDTGQEWITEKIRTLRHVKRIIKANIIYDQHNSNDITRAKLK